MSSTGTPTPHLGLNQWLPNDKPERVDFDSDNLKIDAALKSKANQLNGAELTSLGYTNWNSGNLIIESGTWTPILGNASISSAGTTYLYNVGYYHRFGNMVFLRFHIQVSAVVSDVSNFRATIRGLPFVGKNVIGSEANVIRQPIDYQSLALSNCVGIIAMLGVHGNTVLTLRAHFADGTSDAPHFFNVIQADAILSGTIAYEI